MPTVLFTDKLLHSLTSNGKEREDYSDSLNPGLHLRVTANGRKTWSVVYRIKGATAQQRRTYGPYPRVSLAQARELARADLNSATLGIDPQAANAEPARPLTFGELWEEYRTRYSEAEPKLKSHNQIRQVVTRDLLPNWKDVPAVAIQRRDVIAVIDRVALRGGAIANITLSTISSIYSWGMSKALIDYNPAYRVPRPGAPNPGTRVLNPSELRALYEILEADWAEEVRVCGNARMLSRVMLGRMLEGQREQELKKMEWKQIEGEPPLWWNQPGNITKSGRPNRVPILPLFNDLVLSRLGRDTVRVFPGPNGREVWSDSSTSPYTHNLCSLLGFSFTARDLRRTFVTHAARLRIPEEIRQRFVNHSRRRNVMEVHYDLYQREDELQTAADTMERFFFDVFTGGDGKVKPYVLQSPE